MTFRWNATAEAVDQAVPRRDGVGSGCTSSLRGGCTICEVFLLRKQALILGCGRQSALSFVVRSAGTMGCCSCGRRQFFERDKSVVKSVREAVIVKVEQNLGRQHPATLFNPLPQIR